MLRLFAALHGALGSYLRNALHEGSVLNAVHGSREEAR
jgi:hypothetical protein